MFALTRPQPVLPDAPPSVGLLLGEVRVARDWAMARLRPRMDERPPVGSGQPILTLPGFLAGDMSMHQMRRNLNAAGFKAKRWKQGANLGAREDTIDRMHERVLHTVDREGRKVHLVGWSLGGLFAREYAKHHPENVASVITMGTPFSGSRRANHAWRLYEMVAKHSVESPPVPFHPAPKPTVPTYALWSASDGIIAPACAQGGEDERDAAIELSCGHLGFAYAQEAVDAVIACVMAAERA
jgi:pimeloyl-ACP methyl ester carboxylesterase